jgi:hypothetical protein
MCLLLYMLVDYITLRLYTFAEIGLTDRHWSRD